MIRSSMPPKDNKGFFIRPPRELVNRLEKLALEFKKPSANQVAVEVITEYLDSWVEIEEARRGALSAQQERFERIKSEVMRQPLHEAKTEADDKPIVRRKTR